ncbi:hypothetical protein [Kitasatospora sp. LaBMicrA B282]|uniref:hypothetical protein n=1 Tax=Kitasatospora sp. LaBMicrA B282 TaxID=3420949 RepID=UPI003D13E44E
MSDPTALDTVLQQARRVRVGDSAGRPNGLVDAEFEVDLAAPADLARLRAALAVDSLPGLTCMCMGDVLFEFLDAGARPLTRVVLHHGASLRWPGWEGDAVLRDGRSLLDWLAEHGAPGPLRQFEEHRRQAEQARHEREDWLAALPPELADLTDHLLAPSRTGGSVPGDLLTELARRVTEARPEPADRALALLAWSGAGSGRCSGYPSHEGTPGELLRHLPIEEIIVALQDPRAERRHFDGAVRHLVGWRSREDQQRDIAAIPLSLRVVLLHYGRATDDTDKRARAEQWLAGQEQS